MQRRVTNEIRQRDLDKEARTREHDRRQNLHDVVNLVIVEAIRWIPWIILVLAAVIALGKIFFHYETFVFENWLTAIVSGATGYVIAYLKKNGIDND